eukprot:225628-Pyramimonas_sp.AAC.1
MRSVHELIAHVSAEDEGGEAGNWRGASAARQADLAQLQASRSTRALDNPLTSKDWDLMPWLGSGVVAAMMHQCAEGSNL